MGGRAPAYTIAVNKIAPSLCESTSEQHVSCAAVRLYIRWPFVNETRWSCFGERGLRESAAAPVKLGLRDGKQSRTGGGGGSKPQNGTTQNPPQSCCLWPVMCHCGSRWFILISHHHLETVRNTRPSLIKRCNGMQKTLRNTAPTPCSWANQDVDTLGPIRSCHY